MSNLMYQTNPWVVALYIGTRESKLLAGCLINVNFNFNFNLISRVEFSTRHIDIVLINVNIIKISCTLLHCSNLYNVLLTSLILFKLLQDKSNHEIYSGISTRRFVRLFRPSMFFKLLLFSNNEPVL